jgi:hypothetical protein
MRALELIERAVSRSAVDLRRAIEYEPLSPSTAGPEQPSKVWAAPLGRVPWPSDVSCVAWSLRVRTSSRPVPRQDLTWKISYVTFNSLPSSLRRCSAYPTGRKLGIAYPKDQMLANVALLAPDRILENGFKRLSLWSSRWHRFHEAGSDVPGKRETEPVGVLAMAS